MPNKKKILTKKPAKKATKASKKPAVRAAHAAGPEPLTREGWLVRASELLLPFVRQAAAWSGVSTTLTVPPAVACSWPPGRSTVLLSTSSRHASSGLWEVTLSPSLGHEDLRWPSVHIDEQVLAHLLHELIHCVVGDAEAHRGPFADVAAQVGLISPLAEPRVSAELAQQLHEQIIARIGHYPHRAMEQPVRRSSGNRQKRWVCEYCGKIVRCAGDLQALHLCEDGRKGRFVLSEKS